jgi:hypothetical protein
MKKILSSFIIVILFGVTFGDASIWVCDSNQIAGDEWSFTVCVDSNEDIGGYQFGIDIAGFTTESVEAGADAAAVGMSESGQTFSLGFSFTGAFIPAGDHLEITTFTGIVDNYNGGGAIVTAAGIGNPNITFSTPSGSGMNMTAVDNGWDGAILAVGQPATYNLSNAYPNPFNPTTTIDYNVEIAGEVSIIVYDLAGRKVKTLVNGYKTPSSSDYSVMWDGTNNSGSIVSSGMYLYRMVTADFTKTYRLTFMK